VEPFADLIALARQARDRAYAPYSRVKVGAALLGKSGRAYSGCNVENASYGLTICAERVAIFEAVCAGEGEFEALAVVTKEGFAPCGACRQVMAEFGLDTQVIIADLENGREFHTVRDLLPAAFTPENLQSNLSEDH
jgi:cytidine deaminase